MADTYQRFMAYEHNYAGCADEPCCLCTAYNDGYAAGKSKAEDESQRYLSVLTIRDGVERVERIPNPAFEPGAATLVIPKTPS